MDGDLEDEAALGIAEIAETHDLPTFCARIDLRKGSMAHW